MNSNKVALMVIAVLAIGIFALPSTVSLFSGQHTWYSLEGTGSDVPCEKCHADINDEMISTGEDGNGVHTTLAGPGCNCHRVNTTSTRLGTGVAIGEDAEFRPGTTSHAAETIACMVCHENGTSYPFAGGFNQTAVYAETGVDSADQYYYNASDDSGGEAAAHNQFIREAIKDPLMTDSNEACIACHTRVGVNITWTKNENLVFDATENELGNWTLTGFGATGSNVTQVNYTNEWTNPP